MTIKRLSAVATISASWGVAVLLLLSGSAVCHVVAWSFLAAKAVAIAITLLALLRNRTLAWQILAARYRFDYANPHGLSQALTRFVWEMPQLFVGYCMAQMRVVFTNVDRVDTLKGVTFVTCCHRRKHVYMGMSTGCFVQLWLPVEIKTDFEHYARHYAGKLLLHEYGHTVDSQRWGWLYLPVVGLSSLTSQIMELGGVRRHRHQFFWTEKRADRLGEQSFAKRSAKR